jgi:BirA family biotin operon repressor/biotin-[acetyl-CoA-carboxylase] ligase
MKHQIGQKIIHLTSVDSTNNYTANLLKEGKLEDGAVILTDEQTNGRGQLGAKWNSLPGFNLTVSFYKEFDNLSVDDQFYLSKWFANCVVEALALDDSKLKIKWPNDIYYESKKMGGILIETQLRGKGIVGAIFGLGLNVNQTDFPSLLNATSYKLVTGESMLIHALLFKLIGVLNIRLESLINGEWEGIDQFYFQHLLAYRQKQQFEIKGELFEGIIQNVLQNGQLEVSFESGTKKFDLKELKFVF